MICQPITAWLGGCAMYLRLLPYLCIAAGWPQERPSRASRLAQSLARARRRIRLAAARCRPPAGNDHAPTQGELTTRVQDRSDRITGFDAVLNVSLGAEDPLVAEPGSGGAACVWFGAGELARDLKVGRVRLPTFWPRAVGKNAIRPVSPAQAGSRSAPSARYRDLPTHESLLEKLRSARARPDHRSGPRRAPAVMRTPLRRGGGSQGRSHVLR